MTTTEQQRIAIENRLRSRPNSYDAKAIQIDRDMVWLLGRLGELEAELLRQWRANHATKCEPCRPGTDDCSRQDCHWPKPVALVGVGT
jgi:hypothetical protein